MTSDEELREISYDVLREMYEEAEPGLDFDEALEDPDEMDDDWYQQHSLPKKRQLEIRDKHCEKHNLNDSERSTVTWTAILNYGPSYTPNEEP